MYWNIYLIGMLVFVAVMARLAWRVTREILAHDERDEKLGRK